MLFTNLKTTFAFCLSIFIYMRYSDFFLMLGLQGNLSKLFRLVLSPLIMEFLTGMNTNKHLNLYCLFFCDFHSDLIWVLWSNTFKFCLFSISKVFVIIIWKLKRLSVRFSLPFDTIWIANILRLNKCMFLIKRGRQFFS